MHTVKNVMHMTLAVTASVTQGYSVKHVTQLSLDVTFNITQGILSNISHN